MQTSKTRQEAEQKREAAAKHGLNADDIFADGHRRRAQPTDRLAAPPQNYQDRHGNKVFLGGSSELMRMRIRFSGDSAKDIRELIEQTGRGGPGSGETWHHLADYDPQSGQGTVVLVPTRVHQEHPHVGGSAQKRATDHGGDPDKLAKYGYGNPQ